MRPPTVEEIIGAVCDAAGMPVSELFERSDSGQSTRRESVVEVRAAVAHLLRHRRGMGGPEIAKSLGLRCHNSVHHALKRRSDRVACLIAVATATLKPITENAA